MMTCLMGSLYMTHVYAEQAGRPLLMIWICLIFLTFSGNFSLFITATAKTYGVKNSALNYGILFTSSVSEIWVAIGHVNEYPSMHYFGIPRHTQSIIAYTILTKYFWKSQ